ncbi:hypothetical protein AC579_2479 [Pseudocercospora musae]|uniref:Uncharacterized protein n=1 Tax=Pseudocercospora musae TaxID=113226 RepID=A0A139IFD2_9PEZI|nr:hypothetical protein AC579_2479 [Pseudocercospora musae]
MTSHPFHFDNTDNPEAQKPGPSKKRHPHNSNVRGQIPSFQAARLRTIWLESSQDASKAIATPCTYNVSSRLVQESGLPMIFLFRFAVSWTHGLPDTGYIALEERCSQVQETARQVSILFMFDAHTGYGSPINVRRTVRIFAQAGAAGASTPETNVKTCSSSLGQTHGS